MSFEKKHFSDGEVTFSPPSWRRRLEDLEESIRPTDFKQNEAKRHIKADEVALRHPHNGSFLRIADDGAIEAFTAYGTGLRIRADHTLQLFADRVQAIGREVAVTTGPNGSTPNAPAYPSYPKGRGLAPEVIAAMRESGLPIYGTEEWK